MSNTKMKSFMNKYKEKRVCTKARNLLTQKMRGRTYVFRAEKINVL